MHVRRGQPRSTAPRASRSRSARWANATTTSAWSISPSTSSAGTRRAARSRPRAPRRRRGAAAGSARRRARGTVYSVLFWIAGFGRDLAEQLPAAAGVAGLLGELAGGGGARDPRRARSCRRGSRGRPASVPGPELADQHDPVVGGQRDHVDPVGALDQREPLDRAGARVGAVDERGREDPVVVAGQPRAELPDQVGRDAALGRRTSAAVYPAEIVSATPMIVLVSRGNPSVSWLEVRMHRARIVVGLLWGLWVVPGATLGPRAGARRRLRDPRDRRAPHRDGVDHRPARRRLGDLSQPRRPRAPARLAALRLVRAVACSTPSSSSRRGTRAIACSERRRAADGYYARGPAEPRVRRDPDARRHRGDHAGPAGARRRGLRRQRDRGRVRASRRSPAIT